MPRFVAGQDPASWAILNRNEAKNMLRDLDDHAMKLAAYMSQLCERHGAEIVCVSSDVIECHVARPPVDDEDALALARAQYLYCADIVDQGMETVSALAGALRGALPVVLLVGLRAQRGTESNLVASDPPSSPNRLCCRSLAIWLASWVFTGDEEPGPSLWLKSPASC